jgi:exopolysaccharide biosynthesis predicted pyruvyltransferase EpsI
MVMVVKSHAHALIQLSSIIHVVTNQYQGAEHSAQGFYRPWFRDVPLRSNIGW